MKNLIATLFLTQQIYAQGQYQLAFNTENWKVIEYNKNKPNDVDFSQNEVNIKVDNSAGSIIHTFKKPLNLKKLRLRITHRGNLNLLNKKQGEKETDDYLLRVGIVYQGERTLSSFEKIFAADWLINIFESAPKGSGISSIEFYNIVSDNRLYKKSRKSSSSDYMNEHFSHLSLEKNSQIDMNISLEIKKPIIGIWLCFDGDSTQSQFSLNLKGLTLLSEK